MNDKKHLDDMSELLKKNMNINAEDIKKAKQENNTSDILFLFLIMLIFCSD